jgi:AraC-like DNA-binding protein
MLLRLQQAAGTLDCHKPLSLTKRAATLGPITVLDLAFDVDTWIRCAGERPYYQVNVLAAGQMELLHRGSSIASVPGRANMCVPEGELSVRRWSAGCRMIALRVNRNVLEDALSEAVGRQLTTQVDFKPSIVTTKGPARTWMHLFSVFVREIFQPDNALIQPLVAAPFVHSLIQALLLATDHPYREVLGAQAKFVAPQTIRAAVDLIEAEPHLPLTVATLASQCHISTRALHQGFVRHLGMTPMAYLRQVRLRRAHQDLLASDPSIETVASITKRWGYTNPGRFAATHAARYGETPAATLHRSERAIRTTN